MADGLAENENAIAQLARIEAELDRRANRGPGGSAGSAGDNGDDGSTDLQTATREAEARARSAANIRRQLGDITGVLARREAELADLVAHGNLTQAEANRALREYRDELIASTEEGRAAAAVIAATQTPLEAYNERLFELDRLLASGAISQEVHMRAVIAATDAYEAADPVLTRAAEIREQLMTSEELLARETENVNQLVAAGALTFSEGAEWIERYREQLEETSSAVSELRYEEELLDRILKGQIETWQDLGRVALQVLADIVRQQIAAADSAQGFGSFIAQIIGGTLGSFGGSTASASAAASAPASLGGGPFPTVQVAGAAPSIVVAPRLAAPSAGSGQGGLNVVINNSAGADIEARERRSPTGDRELEIYVRRMVEGQIATGGFDQAMQSRYRLRAAPNGRG
jgi:hypothetical protein